MTSPGETRSLLSGVASATIINLKRYEELKIKLYLSCHLLATLNSCLVSHQHKSKKNEDLNISVIYLSNLSESCFYLILFFLEQSVFLSLYLYFWMPKNHG
jgi:hypothetical protein